MNITQAADPRGYYVRLISTLRNKMMQDAVDTGDYSQCEEKEQTIMETAVRLGMEAVGEGLWTIDQLHDAAWEAFDGLLEAHCVTMNVQHYLGMEVEQPGVMIIEKQES